MSEVCAPGGRKRKSPLISGKRWCRREMQTARRYRGDSEGPGLLLQTPRVPRETRCGASIDHPTREHQAGQGQLRLWGQPPLCTHFSTYSITTFSNSSRLYYGASHLQASLAAKGLVSQKKLDSTEKTALLTAT